MNPKCVYYNNMLAKFMVGNTVTVRNFKGTTEKLERGVLPVLITV
jgi:hypothetical protein